MSQKKNSNDSNDDEKKKETKETKETKVEPLYRTRLERAMRTSVSLMEVTLADWDKWPLPFGEKIGPNKEDGFQRPYTQNKYVIEVAHTISQTGCVPGQIVVGIFQDTFWLIDGQHRKESFQIAVHGDYGVRPITKACVNIKFEEFDSWAAMATRFAELQRKIRGNEPNDMLKALEFSNDALKTLRKGFPQAGYQGTKADSIKRHGRVSVTALLKAWYGSELDLPNRVQVTPYDLAKQFAAEDARDLVRFLKCAAVWSFHLNYLNLWFPLNLTLCLWLYRRSVLKPEDGFPVLTDAEFVNCLAALQGVNVAGTTQSYPEYLYRKELRENDRGPTYGLITKTFAAAIRAHYGRRVKFPIPSWAAAKK